MKRNKARNSPKKNAELNILKPLERVYGWKFFPLAFSLLFMAVMMYFALTLHKVGDIDVETDFYGGYAPEARDFMMGKIVIDAYHGPLYPWVLGMLGRIVGDIFTTGVLISVISASLVIYFVFVIIRSISSTDVAFLAAILTAVNTTFVTYSYYAGTDMFFVMLSLAGVLLLFRKTEISLFEISLSAVLLSCSYLVRYNGLIFLISIPVVILSGAIQIKGSNKYIAAAIWVVTFLIIIAPWSIYLRINKGSFFYNANYQNTAFELFGGGYGNWDKFWSQQAKQYTSYWDVIAANPVLFAQTIVRNVYSHFVGDMTDLNNKFVGASSALGAVLFAFSHPPRRKIGLVLIFIFFFCVLLTVFYTARFSLFLLPMYSFFAAYLVKTILAKIRAKKSAITVVNLLAVGAVIVTFADSYAFNSTNIIPSTRYILDTSKWFHQQFDDKYENQRIAARKPHIAYFLNMRFYQFPVVDSYDSLIAVLRRDSVKFLYYGTIESSDRPQFKDLLSVDKEHPGLRPLSVEFGPENEVVALFYEVTK